MHGNWLELLATGLTALAVALFVAVGLALRRYAGARLGRRPVNESCVERIFRRSRLCKLTRFAHISSSVLEDADPLLTDCTRRAEARAFRPVVSEIRRQGEHLIATRRWYHQYLTWNTEKKLDVMTEKIVQIESLLRTLPSSELTLEDVLAGRFPENQLTQNRSLNP